MFEDTIAAIATPNGVGSIAIVRVSGKKALDVGLQITKKSRLTPRYATLSNLFTLEGDFIDEGITIYFESPRSFTTEDVVEFQVHGGYIVAALLLEEILKCNVRLATPGEFSKRAYLGGRIDLTKAESIAKLIEAKSKDAHRMLSSLLKGDLEKFVHKSRDELVGVLASIEVSIDYADEDLPQDLKNSIAKKLEEIRFDLEKIYDNSKQREGMIEGFKISIIGKPNSGKSSLLNKILMFDRAIVSEIEGTTRDTVEESIRIGTHILKIVDTAGIRDTSNTIEKIGIDRSIESIQKSDIVVVLFDRSREFDENDKKILEIVEEHKDSKNFIIAINKIDLPAKLDTKKFSDFDIVEISCKKELSVLLEKIESILNSKIDYEGLAFISKRQVEIAKRALTSLEDSIERFEDDELELSSYSINDAIKSISEISRAYENSEMLERMFGEFCLGK